MHSHLAGAPTHLVLATLDHERRIAEAEGRYLDAQRCVDLMKSVTVEETNLAQKEVRDTAVQRIAAAEAVDRGRQQMLAFTQVWEHALRQFDAQADEAIASMRARHAREFEEEEELLRTELASQRPHFSRRVIQLRENLERQLQLQQYREADKLKRELTVAEEDERRLFEENLSIRFSARTRDIKRHQQLELIAFRQRVSSGRDELLVQRRADHDTIVQRQANAVAAAEQRTRTTASVATKALQRQLDVISRQRSAKRGAIRVHDM